MPGNYCTVADVKEYLTMTATDWDALISKIIPRVCRWWDSSATNMPLGWDEEVVTENISPIIDSDGNLTFLPGKPFITSISALNLSTSPGTPPMTLDPTLIWLPSKERERLVIQDGRWWGYRGKRLRLTATYTGGFNPVPDDVAHACVVMSARIFKQKDAGFSDVVGAIDSGMMQYSKLMTKEVKSIADNRKRVSPR